ncbi:MAG: TonB-dependent receptor [Bacteroidota bacterium]
MSRKHFLTTALVAAAINATAQQDTLQGKATDPVIVTANKLEQKQSTTGKVVTVIGKEQIEKSTGKSVAQVLNEQAGITIAGAYNAAGSVQTVFMRGASAGRTLILMDGIPVNDPSQISNDYDLNLFSINDVERIEVCRGAQSTLYGSDAVAGVINIITIKKDIKKPFNVKATGVAGSLGTYKANVQLFGKADKLTYSTRYAKLKTNGFSSAYDSSGAKGFDNDGYSGDAMNATLQYAATKQILLKSFIQYSTYKADIDAGIFTDDKDYTIHNKNLSAGFGFQFKNDVVMLVGNYQYNQLQRNYLNDSGFIAGFSKYESNQYKGRTQFAELYASIKLGAGFTLLQGADYRYGLMNNDYLSISSFGPYSTSFKDTSMSQGSMYASLLYNGAGKKFNAEIGGRLNVHSRYGSNSTYTINPSYNISEHYRIFGSVASGFKAPSLYQLYAGGGTGNPNLKAEKSVNYEAGIGQQHKGISSRLVYFYRTIKDGIDYNSLTFKYFNFVKQIVRGLEYEVNVQATKKLNINANYTFISSQENTQSRVNFKDTSYNYLLRRPKHNINVNIGYQFTDGLYASISSKYVSKRKDVGGYKRQDVEMDGYFLLNAYAEYKLKDHFKFFADAQNITNKKFFDIRGYTAIPFMFNAGVTFNW